VLKTSEPSGRKAGVKVKTVAETRRQAARRSGSDLTWRFFFFAEVSNGHLSEITSRALTAALHWAGRSTC